MCMLYFTNFLAKCQPYSANSFRDESDFGTVSQFNAAK